MLSNRGTEKERELQWRLKIYEDFKVDVFFKSSKKKDQWAPQFFAASEKVKPVR